MSERLIPESQLRQAIKEILAEMLGVGSPSPRKAYPTAKAIELLGFDNRDQLYNAIASGLLRLGKEVEDRRKPSGQMPRYYFDIEKCRERLKALPEKRK